MFKVLLRRSNSCLSWNFIFDGTTTLSFGKSIGIFLRSLQLHIPRFNNTLTNPKQTHKQRLDLMNTY